MIELLPPGAILILGGLLAALLPSRLRPWAGVVLPVLGFAHLLTLDKGFVQTVVVFGQQLTPVRVDGLSLTFGYVFFIAAILGGVYGLQVRDGVQVVAAQTYVGSAIGAIFAGDLVTLFIYWELTAVTSVFLVWAGRTARSARAGMRYLIIQVGSGVVLLAGVILHFVDTGSLDFVRLIGADGRIAAASVGVILVFIAFGIKCAFPLLHNWLQDAYPESTPTGTVYLSIFTTKLAVYALARGFPGTGVLIVIGAVMTVFPIFFAVIENDLRRVLTYSLNNQLGFMVVGIGIGTELAINGAAAYAFANIIFEGLLFMAMGAVLLRTGTCLGSELGGLYKTMPWTAALCIVGAASISAFPFLSGFVTKPLILDETAAGHHVVIWLMLLFASAGVFHHSGIKIPYFAFFAHDSGKRVKEAPWNMLLAMAVMAVMCIGIGVAPEVLYRVLPYPMEYHAYTTTHVVTQYQLLLFSALAFTFLQLTGLYPPELRSTNLDFDWTYRRLLPAVVRGVARGGRVVVEAFALPVRGLLDRVHRLVFHLHGPEGVFARTWTTGAIAFWAVIVLAASLLLYLVDR
ncbi:MAG: Na(+)/H(+) antiporter subunit D [Thermoanaerobaculales bacterium]|jgi:multicomponent Na+:H+ antiporter subunit D|nr:Na(+)/H(+) antiporter subunit D [Thermoanaerobaculales bacterium]